MTPRKQLSPSKEALLLLISLVPVGVLLLTADRIPDEVPVHFNFQGEADRYGSPWLLALLAAGLYLVLLLPLYIDPKREDYQQFMRSYFSIRVVILGFMSLINGLLLLEAAGMHALNVAQIIPAGVFVLLAALGNYLISVRPNYFIGIRTPWTLHSELVWRRTHRFSGRLWFGMGLAGALGYLFLPSDGMMPWTGIWFGFMVLVPLIYSYQQYRRLHG